jgi:hypothetical protein
MTSHSYISMDITHHFGTPADFVPCVMNTFKASDVCAAEMCHGVWHVNVSRSILEAARAPASVVALGSFKAPVACFFRHHQQLLQ